MEQTCKFRMFVGKIMDADAEGKSEIKETLDQTGSRPTALAQNNITTCKCLIQTSGRKINGSDGTLSGVSGNLHTIYRR